jgi:signal transduction histidine kinase
LEGKSAILYVDDRMNNLLSFKATFRREYDVFIAESPREALKILEQNPIKVAVADYKMPEISGVTFLEIVKKQYPKTVRIMLTGHADLPAVVEAINRSEIFRFLAKPWNEEDLRKGIKSAVELYDTRKLLVQKNDELKKAYNELDRLVFSTAHDITGPLSNVLGLVDIIRSEPDNTEEYLELIERTTKKLQFIARDVLSFHRNKRTELRIKKIDLKRVIEDTIADHQFFEKIGNLQYEIEVDSPVPFYSDISRLRFILNNLVSNAIKYQDENKEHNWVKISFSNTEEKGVLLVEDNGVGIDADILPKIFDIYYRASNQSTGAGIGLYIATEAVNLLHGEISVDSKMGQGTTFKIELPNSNVNDLDHSS